MAGTPATGTGNGGGVLQATDKVAEGGCWHGVSPGGDGIKCTVRAAHLPPLDGNSRPPRIGGVFWPPSSALVGRRLRGQERLFVPPWAVRPAEKNHWDRVFPDIVILTEILNVNMVIPSTA